MLVTVVEYFTSFECTLFNSYFACFPGTQTNGLDFQKQPVPVGGAISTAQAQAFLGHLHQVDC